MGNVTYAGNVTYEGDVTYVSNVIYTANVIYAGNVTYAGDVTYTGDVTHMGDVTYESFLLLLFLKDNGIVLFCLLTISSGKFIVFYNSDHIKCLLTGTCRPHTVTCGRCNICGLFLVIVLETVELVLFLVY